jgi:hypothetical protein
MINTRSVAVDIIIKVALVAARAGFVYTTFFTGPQIHFVVIDAGSAAIDVKVVLARSIARLASR